VIIMMMVFTTGIYYVIQFNLLFAKPDVSTNLTFAKTKNYAGKHTT
jgi:hypothetical protein